MLLLLFLLIHELEGYFASDLFLKQELISVRSVQRFLRPLRPLPGAPLQQKNNIIKPYLQILHRSQYICPHWFTLHGSHSSEKRGHRQTPHKLHLPFACSSPRHLPHSSPSFPRYLPYSAPNSPLPFRF